jgi:hypothetical protein
MKTVLARTFRDEPVTAVARANVRKRQGVHATAVRYLPAVKSLLVSFADQSALALPVKNYPELAELKVSELKRMDVGFAGAALCLDERDLHISIAGLVSASGPLMQMAASVIATRNGQRGSAAKAPASGANGAKGGRPRRTVAGG